MLNDTATPLSLLATRRSGKPRDLGDPGPGDDQLDAMLTIAARTPDHGKLAPWRFVVIPADQRAALADRLCAILRERRPDAPRGEIETVAQFAMQAPALVVVLASPKPDSHIPLWEQDLSAGAACMNLLHAAHAMGFAGGWLTGWMAFDDRVRDLFGVNPERIAGFVFIGTPTRPVEERPRPEMARIVSRWKG